MPTRFVGLGAALAAIALAGCTLPRALPSTQSLEPPPGHIVIVGKIVLDPPFSPELEQKTHWNVVGDGAIRNRALIATGDKPVPIQSGSFRGSDWQGYIDARWGEYFAAVAPRRMRYLNGVAVPLDVKQQDYYWFPGGLVYLPPIDGDVVYLGTLRYVRNDFNEIIDVQVLEQSEEARAELENRYGGSAAMAQALWPWHLD